MVESSKGQHEEFEDDEEVVTHKGKSREKNRTKHSETEQRRRSKINERFQILRDLIPQNDQKRDKASFLLEVIEYIQYLQEKLTMYEGSYQGSWSSEPRKLIPWKNDHVSTEGFSDPSQVIKNGSDLQNNVVLPPMLHNPQNSLESDMGSAMVYKTLDHLSGSATHPVSLNVQEMNMFDPIERRGLPSQSLQESISDIVRVESLPPSQPSSWPSGHTTTARVNNTSSGQEEKRGSVSVSNSVSQGVLDNLTQALQSSGVDLARASISVQIDVANPTDSRLTSVASASKDHLSRSLNDEIMKNSQVTIVSEKYEQAHKRLRVEQK